MNRRWWVPLLVLLVVVAACSSGGDEEADAPEDESTTTTSAPPETLPEGARQVAVEDLDTGDCFNIVSGAGTETVFAIPCETPHDNEVFQLTVYQGEDAGAGEPYPGDVEVKDYSEGVCIEAFEAFVGIPWTQSDFDAQAFYPSQEDWEVGSNRDITCYLNSFYGEKLTGSMQGAAE